MKPVFRRRRVDQDLRDACNYYLNEGAPEAASRFVDAIEATFVKIAANPAAGSPRYAIELHVPDLRFWLVPRFPYLAFYLDLEDRVEIVRVLHTKNDIPELMGEAAFVRRR
ncbi:MAG: type II toxin-antitoxin system RelE/ParE family toxin [Parvularculaceae bacterium]